ncbi:hypothetical protein RhiJN_10508 [Ceratobasidium sp. AG-Ba]|nr:hypothetical protein RhiJN_10508 [Ceratobasidium sp. AG-Ba]QRW11245.1 hypothetical protein RhiLY_10244 [Ceratobasidium sp. AG-Ba]
MAEPQVIVHPPDSFHSSLSRDEFDIDKFMGKWHVIWSTLPLWKSRSDVTITYSPLVSESPSTTPESEPIRFDDIVEYRSRSSPGSTRSTIVGVDTLEITPKGAPEGYKSGVSYNWRGKGWLKIASSHWQVLGYDAQAGWAVTYFSKTLFTPAGLDVYVRDPTAVSKELVEEIINAATAVGGEVGKLAEGFFEVPVTE